MEYRELVTSDFVVEAKCPDDGDRCYHGGKNKTTDFAVNGVSRMKTIIVIFIIVIVVYDLVKAIIFAKEKISAKLYMTKKTSGFVHMETAIVASASTSEKQLKEVVEPIKPVIKYWGDDTAEEFECKVGDELHMRIKNSKKVLAKHGICRKCYLSVYSIALSDKGKTERKWDDGGRVWQASDLTASMFEAYFRTSDNSMIAS